MHIYKKIAPMAFLYPVICIATLMEGKTGFKLETFVTRLRAKRCSYGAIGILMGRMFRKTFCKTFCKTSRHPFLSVGCTCTVQSRKPQEVYT